MSNDFRRHSQGYGFIAPFCMLALCIIWIYYTPTTPETMKTVSGDIKQQSYFKDIILLQGDDTKYIIGNESEIVQRLLESKKKAVIWIEEDEKLDRKVIKQLELDGEIIIEYNYLKDITIPIVFGVIGLLLIPIVIRAKRKQRARGE
jgi:hypothetical protein